MDLIETKVNSELKYSGVIVDVTLDDARLSDGSIAKREVVFHPGGVGVLPMDDEGMCYMVRQYRYPVEDTMLEIPAGKLDKKGEDHMECAVRELSEETGFTADEFIDLGMCYTSPGYSNEIIHVYLALGLHAGESHLDEGEFLNVEKLSFDELIKQCMDNKLQDAKTVIALTKAKLYLDSRK